MKKYARTFLTVLLGSLGLFAGFNLAVDPYDVVNVIEQDGFNARKTRAHEDGRRIQVSHQLTESSAQSIIIGSSRVVDGFPLQTDAWPGGLYNAGIRGSTNYERAHVAALALQKPNLRCVIIGFGAFANNQTERHKSAFFISRLPDGRKNLSVVRMMLSPNTFGRSVQTVRDNMTGGSDDFPFRETYAAGQQRKFFTRAPNGMAAATRDFVTIESDMDLMFKPLEALAESGVQIIGFMSPTHAFSEEAGYRNQTDHYYQRKKDLAKRFNDLRENYEPAAPCTDDKDAVLWDFTGFQPFTTTGIPDETQTAAHPLFHEPAHYREPVGRAFLARILGQDIPANIPDGVFGLRLTPDFPAGLKAQTEQRRAEWLKTEDGQYADDLLDGKTGNGTIRNIPPLESELRQIEELIDSLRAVR